jgi:hypothetical protein
MAAMADDETKSPGGSAIHRYQASEREWQAPARGDGSEEIVAKHFAALGIEAQTVLHEIISDLVHIDVHVSQPTPERPFYTLFTTGMADLPMTVPDGQEQYRYAELMICLPSDWPMPATGQATTGDTAYYWPIGILKFLARFPHEYKTWLCEGHTLPNGDPPAPFDDSTQLCCALLAPPLTIPRDGHQVRIREDKLIHFYAVLLIHKTEMELKLAKGVNALFDALDRKKVNEILDPARPPATKRGLFSIF